MNKNSKVSLEELFTKLYENIKKNSRVCPCCGDKNFQITFKFKVNYNIKDPEYEEESLKNIDFSPSEILCSECEIAWSEDGTDRNNIQIVLSLGSSWEKACCGTHLYKKGDKI